MKPRTKEQLQQDLKTYKERLDAALKAPQELISCTATVDKLESERLDILADADARNQKADTIKIGEAILKAKADQVKAKENCEIANRTVDLIKNKLLPEIQKKLDALEEDRKINGVNEFESAYAHAIETDHAIQIKLSEVQAEANASTENIRQLVRDCLDGKVYKRLRKVEEVLLPEFISEIDSLSAAKLEKSDGIRIIRSETKVVKTPDQNDSFRDSSFRKLEFELREAVAIAEVQSEVLENDSNKKALLKILKSIGAITQSAVRDKGLVAPQWAFAGSGCWRDWTSEEDVAPIHAFLCDHNLTTI